MAEGDARSTCQWCDIPVADSDVVCPNCGARLAEPDSLQDVVIPGVTAMEAGLQAYDAQPWRLTRPSPSHSYAAGAVVAAAAGGPVGLVALAGLAAVAASEYQAAGTDSRTVELDRLGELPGYVTDALARADADGSDAAGGPDERNESSTQDGSRGT